MQLMPIKFEALTDHVCQELERAILTSEIRAGEKLPPERDLANMLSVSRPILHDALLILAHKGLVTLVPRVGTIVNDFRELGSLELLEALMTHGDRHMTPKLLKDILVMRGLFEVDMAHRAARMRNVTSFNRIQIALSRELRLSEAPPRKLAEADFEFHLSIALASGNTVYPMLLNSSRGLYKELSHLFYHDPQTRRTALRWHEKLTDAIEAMNDKLAADVMRRLLAHGEQWLASNYNPPHA
jgi:fatty acid metabolism transcriptional regulator FadR